MRIVRASVTAFCALLGAVLLFTTARRHSWGAPTKVLPENRDGEPFTAITLELPGSPAWVLLGSAVAGALAFGAAGWLSTGLLAGRRGP